ncbi:MAG: GAF domain-containing protein [Vicinamibacteria bacterium]
MSETDSGGAPRLLNPDLYRRGTLITTVSRWASFGLALLGVLLLWQDPDVRPLPALAVGGGYSLFALGAALVQRRRGRIHWLRVAHDVVDALAVGLGAAFTGGTVSPVWLFLYPHVVAVSVRGGLGYALTLGLLDAAVLLALVPVTREPTNFASLYAVSLVWCAFMGGVVSSYLKATQSRLGRANAELQGKNAELEQALQEAGAARRRQDEALARLEAGELRYRRLLERIQDGVLIITGGRVSYANDVFARMAGDTPQGLVGLDFLELAPAENRRELQERYQRWEASEAVAGELETRMLTRSGQLLTVSLKAGSAEWEGRRSVIATVRDITRERRMEQEVKDHAARLAAINEVANAVNQSLTIEDIFGVAAAELRRLLPFERLTIVLLDEAGPELEVVAVGPGLKRQRPPFRRDEVAWAFRRPLAWHEGGEEPRPPRLHELIADPSVRAAVTLPLLSKGRVIGALCLGRFRPNPFPGTEIAVVEPVASHIGIALDNARLLEAVRRRSREFESLVEIGRRIVERLELKEILPLVTRAVNRIMGTHFCMLMLRQGDELRVVAQEGLEPEVVARLASLRIGQSLSGWVAQHGRPLVISDMEHEPRARFQDVVTDYGYRSFLCVPLRRSGETLGTLEVVTKEYRSFSAEEQDIMLAFADQAAVAIDNARLFRETREHLESLAAANLRLEQLDRLRQEYLRNVSHEFRTPLTVIRGYAEYLQGADELASGPLRDVTRVMIESCDRVIDLVDTLIEVSRVEQGIAAASLRRSPLDLRAVARASLEPLGAAAERRGIAIELDFPEQPLSVQGDPDLLPQVFRKLVDNAIKYCGDGRRVVVRARPLAGGALLEVQDFGIGIAPENRERIFEKFFMVDGGLTRRVGGTGVGLYLAREILKLHGGTIEVESAPGAGSVFRVKLPREVPPAGGVA